MPLVVDVQDLKRSMFWLSVLAEFLGTLLLVLFACGSCSTGRSVTDISLSFGVTVATVVWTIAHVSGGHINPAVSFGFLIARREGVVRIFLYIVAQCLGAILGAVLLRALTLPGSNDSLCTSQPAAGVSVAQTLFVELAVTFLLVFTVFATVDQRRKGFNGSGPLAIGLSITVGHLWAVPVTGAGTNPARVFGPAIVSGTWEKHWAYWIGPLLGGALAALLYELVFAMNHGRAKLRAFFTTADYNDEQFDDKGLRAGYSDLEDNERLIGDGHGAADLELKRDDERTKTLTSSTTSASSKQHLPY